MSLVNAGKTPNKETITVSFREIPEEICVELRFIPKATALLNKFQNVYYMHTNNGQVEISSFDTAVANPQPQNLRQIRPVAKTIQATINNTIPKPFTFAPILPKISGQQFTPVLKNMPISMNMPIYNTANITNFTAPKASTQVSISGKTLPPPQLPTAAFNTSISSFIKPPVATRDTACLTDPKPKCIEREQQTFNNSVLSVGIQCCIDYDLFDNEEVLEMNGHEEDPADVELNENARKEAFLQYVSENSVGYKNRLRECLICGEVCKSSKYFYGHMAVHRGPKCLCFACGQHLENESLLKSHYCVRTKFQSKALLRCPHKRCKIVAMSRLELYEHINEHNNNRLQYCSACRKSFCTAQEFLRHLLLRAKCYSEAKRTHTHLYGLRARNDRLCRVRVFTLHSYTRRTALVKRPLTGRRTKKHFCEFCYKSFQNKYIYHRHVKKCIKLLKNQYKPKKCSTKQNKNSS